jgi:hypothetical protein
MGRFVTLSQDDAKLEFQPQQKFFFQEQKSISLPNFETYMALKLAKMKTLTMITCCMSLLVETIGWWLEAGNIRYFISRVLASKSAKTSVFINKECATNARPSS